MSFSANRRRPANVTSNEKQARFEQKFFRIVQRQRLKVPALMSVC